MGIITQIESMLVKYTYTARGWKFLDEYDGIMVFKNNERIVMKYGLSTLYSVISKKSLYTHSYFDYFIPLAYLYKDPKVLLIGIGGGTIIVQLNKLLGSSLQLEAVDISKGIVDMAKEYFLDNIPLNYTIMDGAEYVSSKKDRYNLIILDAYKGLEVPGQFFEDSFMENAKAALTDDGILAINMTVDDLRLIGYVSKLEKYFKVYRFRTSLIDTNTILICSKKLDSKSISTTVLANMPKTSDNEFLFRRYEQF